MNSLLKSLFYVFTATALVTIAPFLISFEKGQGVEHGLLDFGILTILLFYAVLKGRFLFLKNKILAAMTYVLLVAASWIDLLTIFAEKKRSVGWYGFIPFVVGFLALVLLKDVKRLSFRSANIVLFVSFFAHFAAVKIYPDQSVLQFSIPLYLAQQQKSLDRGYLSKDFRLRYNVTDSVSVTKSYMDTTRSNVVVLVESWGVPMDSVRFNKELAAFNGVVKEWGAHRRMYSHTQSAEKEDLLDFARRDSVGNRDSLFLPKRFAMSGKLTAFLFGGDSTFQRRNKYIRKIGFQSIIWMDSITADSVMAEKADSLLSYSACVSVTDSACVKHQFIAWTTCDTRFPISDDPVETERLYYERLFGTLKIVAALAKKHPDVRFVVQGDHEPILAPMEFQQKFYRRWVPYVVLN